MSPVLVLQSEPVPHPRVGMLRLGPLALGMRAPLEVLALGLCFMLTPTPSHSYIYAVSYPVANMSCSHNVLVMNI